PIWNKLHFTPVYINPEDIALEQIDLAFETVNIKTDQLLYIPDGLKIKVIEDGAKEIYSRITYTRSFYTIKIRKNPARTSLDLSFETKDQWVDCSDPNAPKIVTKTLEEMAQMHFDERSKFYDLPEKWHSKNWMVKRGGNWVKFSDTIMNRSGGVITVNLDTTVLVNGSMNPETVTSSDRFTIFTHKLKIINSDSDRGFLTSGTVDKNLFDKILMGWRPRLFAWNSNFYDCTLKRLYTGDYIGVRAAVKCDPDDHSTASIVEPVVSGAGNFDLHYLKDCLDPDGKGIDGLLVHWVCKFTLDTGVNANHVANFDTQGFNNAITRWQAKKYHFVPDADPQNRKLVVWPFFFFEHRDANPHKCNVTLHLADGGRSDMGITNGNFKTPDYCGHGASVSEDSVTYARFTMAHEIGHAMGLDDEYRESLEVDNSDRITWWNPPLPRFQQWYPGMPYCIDNRAMMVSNKAPRLRHFWYWCRWVNETTDVKRLTGNSVFHVENGLGKSYKFFIKDAMNNIYKSVVNEENKHNGSSGIFDLYLYKCGADETADLMITGKSDFDSTLVIRIKLQWFFDDYSGATWASIDSKLDHLRQFQNRIDARLNGKFYLESADDDFKKVYIQFVPHYYFEGTTIHDHFEITVKANNTGSTRYQPDFNGDNFTSDEFAVDQIQDETAIMRYMLGLAPFQSTNTPAGVTKTAITTINAADLQFVADWVSSKRGGAAFTVKT
ncbi:MAG TPA: hypothetical protein DEO84_03715, partial [candidate division Zixibacteria bacterium]|nr:hypothetical protein [candidate division Zixibacteria bacterium]